MSEEKPRFKPLLFVRQHKEVMLTNARLFRETMEQRRSVREFSPDPVPQQVIHDCLRTAGSAPSGANRQPWHFAVVTSVAIKRQIREGAEAEERDFYQRRAPDDWLAALAPLGTDANKPFLETAPCLIVVFAEKFSQSASGSKRKNYYVTESACLATGFLLAALHNAGLATLTHTPSPMKFLNSILSRPDTEKPLMVIVTGYPAEQAKVPDITRKDLKEFTSFH